MEEATLFGVHKHLPAVTMMTPQGTTAPATTTEKEAQAQVQRQLLPKGKSIQLCILPAQDHELQLCCNDTEGETENLVVSNCRFTWIYKVGQNVPCSKVARLVQAMLGRSG